MTRRLPRLILVTLVLTASARLAHADEHVPFRLLARHYIVVDVTVTDASGATITAPFVVDTASSISVVTPRLAERLRLVAGSTRRTVTQTGADVVPSATLPQLRLGTLAARDLPVVINTLGPLTVLDRGLAGIVGQDLLERVNYLVDYRRSRIELDRGGRLRATLRGVFLPVSRVRRRLLIAAGVVLGQAKAARPVLLALDSAASSVMIFQRHVEGKETVALHGRTEIVWMTSVTGRRSALRGHTDALQVGGHVVRDAPVTVADRPSAWQAVDQDGLLPTALFDAVYFDNDAQRVVINPERRADPALNAMP